ncbi:MAG TPA: type II toxin-antitoxin system RelE/ParE family toxin [Burkholderiaceae bacterium]|nr:type II toxin-antitoxin system RelE/ParE family toxin [Burkholderiaceae bacterium]
MKVRFAPDAHRELVAAAQWYLDEAGVLVAADFQAAINRAVRLLAHMPRLGTSIYPPVRAWPLKRFPYTVLYRPESDGILVVAVAHQRREPGYWKRRR